MRQVYIVNESELSNITLNTTVNALQLYNSLRKSSEILTTVGQVFDYSKEKLSTLESTITKLSENNQNITDRIHEMEKGYSTLASERRFLFWVLMILIPAIGITVMVYLLYKKKSREQNVRLPKNLFNPQ